MGYLAAIFEQAGHEVEVTREEFVEGDIALVLSSLVDYRHEIEWAQEAKRRYGMRVGFFGAPATHMPELLEGHADFLIKGEPEQAAIRIAAGEVPSGVMASPAIDRKGNIGIGYSFGGTPNFPGQRFAGGDVDPGLRPLLSGILR